MPKTTVSRRIAELEREVGIRLLQRTTRSLNMTDAGRLYYEESSRGLRAIEDANLRLADARAEPSGTICVSAPVAFGSFFLADTVFDFLAAYPKTRVELRLTDDKLNLVENGIDLAFRMGTLADSTLVARKLGSTHRILCASPAYLELRGVPAAAADLSRHDCVIAGHSIAGAQWALEGPRGPETISVSGRIAANTMQLAFRAAVAGYGIACCPPRLWARQRGAVAPFLSEYAANRRILRRLSKQPASPPPSKHYRSGGQAHRCGQLRVVGCGRSATAGSRISAMSALPISGDAPVRSALGPFMLAVDDLPMMTIVDRNAEEIGRLIASLDARVGAQDAAESRCPQGRSRKDAIRHIFVARY